MSKYYFTYGSGDDEQPFFGGWTEILAEDETEAREKHRKKYGLSKNGFLRFSNVYIESQFKESGMLERGNFGMFCNETIE